MYFTFSVPIVLLELLFLGNIYAIIVTYSQWLLFDIILLPFLCTYHTAKTIETFQICRIIGLKEKLWFATLLQQEFQAKATSSLHTYYSVVRTMI